MKAKKSAQIGYKVVSFELRSAMWMGKIVQYAIGQPAYRPGKCGPLAVFDSLELAVIWMHTCPSQIEAPPYRLFKCSYTISVDTFLWTPRSIHREYQLPIGTVLADQVTLLKEINI